MKDNTILQVISVGAMAVGGFYLGKALYHKLRREEEIIKAENAKDETSSFLGLGRSRSAKRKGGLLQRMIAGGDCYTFCCDDNGNCNPANSCADCGDYENCSQSGNCGGGGTARATRKCRDSRDCDCYWGGGYVPCLKGQTPSSSASGMSGQVNIWN